MNLPVKYEGQITNPPAVIMAGVSVTPGSTAVTATRFDSSENVLECFGTTVPGTEAGFAKGCVFIKTNAGAGIVGTYENIGTTAASNFQLKSAAVANVVRSQMSTPAGSKIQEARPATIATTGNTDIYVVVGEAGSLDSVDFSAVDALAAHDTNYVTFSITNLGQAGAGSTAMLAATDANTTKLTGGSAISANTKRSLTVHGTAGNLVVAKGDRLLVRVAAAATSANTMTFPNFCLRFSGTT